MMNISREKYIYSITAIIIIITIFVAYYTNKQIEKELARHIYTHNIELSKAIVTITTNTIKHWEKHLNDQINSKIYNNYIKYLSSNDISNLKKIKPKLEQEFIQNSLKHKETVNIKLLDSQGLDLVSVENNAVISSSNNNINNLELYNYFKSNNNKTSKIKSFFYNYNNDLTTVSYIPIYDHETNNLLAIVYITYKFNLVSEIIQHLIINNEIDNITIFDQNNKQALFATSSLLAYDLKQTIENCNTYENIGFISNNTYQCKYNNNIIAGTYIPILNTWALVQTTKNSFEYNLSQLRTPILYAFIFLIIFVVILCLVILKLLHAQQEIFTLAYYDKLTGLINRSYFNHLFEIEIHRAKRNEKLLGVLYIDLDNFKSINDNYGHNIGDILLKNVAEKLLKLVRDTDIVARIGGDEFIVLLTDIEYSKNINYISRKILDYFTSKIFTIKNIDINITLSIGSSIYPLSSENQDELLKQADIAMYRTKRSGRNNSQNYLSSIDDQYKEQSEIITKLPFALKNNELFLVYQPVINISTNKIIAYEALLRWHIPNKGLIPPAKFIPVAEENGIYSKFGFWIIETAFKQLKQWENNIILDDNYLSINLSATQINDEKFVKKIIAIADKIGIDKKKVGFEVTESAIVKKEDITKQVINSLYNNGFKILIDDFGTGFSSFRRLKELSFSKIKIDKSFIDDIGINHTSEKIIKAIINLADILNLEVVAEGVETKEQIEFLRNSQCYNIQGFYYSEPLSAKSVNNLDLTNKNIKK